MNESHDFPTIDYIYDCSEATPEKILPVDQRMQRQNENKNKQTKNCLSKLYKKQHQVFSVFFDSEDKFLKHLLPSRNREFRN